MKGMIKVHCWGEAMWFTPVEGNDQNMIAKLENHPFMQTGLKFGNNYPIKKIQQGGLEWWEMADESHRVPDDMEKLATVFGLGEMK